MKINVRQPKQPHWGNQYDLPARRIGRHQQHCLQLEQRPGNFSAYFRAERAGGGHNQEHVWRKVAAVRSTHALLPALSRISHYGRALLWQGGHPYCPEHQREIDAMEKSDKD